MPKKPIIIKRIPFDNWRNSQLSVARFYWGININGESWVLDPVEMEKLKDPNVK